MPGFLPWFGGGPGVWTTCLLFFQVLLLAGYAYAHVTSRQLKLRHQIIVHVILLGTALALLPITPVDAWKPRGDGQPVLAILALLAVNIGLPYFVLSSTSPLLQQWYSRSHPGASPYRLFALSNAGALPLVLLGGLYFRFAEQSPTEDSPPGGRTNGILFVLGAIVILLLLRAIWLRKNNRPVSPMHGAQFTDPAKAAWPTIYYGEESGVGLALRALPAGGRRLGLVGLGAGTLATYARPEDSVHFYEIDPEMSRLAASTFTYVTNCRAKLELTSGDARLSLECQAPQGFDLLALDAFSSDAIPVHLLTAEAFEVYRRHLKTNGVIAVHISNKWLDLEPVLANVAAHFNYQLVVIDHLPAADQWWLRRSTWALLTRNADLIDAPAIRAAGRPAGVKATSVPLWTDDFSSLVQILQNN